MKINTKLLALLILFSIAGIACNKVIEVDPPIDRYSSKTVFNEKATVVAMMTGIYEDMATSGGSICGESGIGIRSGLLADELMPTNPSSYPDYRNQASGNGVGYSCWAFFYSKYIYRLNSIIEGVSSSSSLSEDTKLTIVSEARFCRRV